MSFYFMHAFHNLKLCNVQCMQCTMVAYLCGPLYHLCAHTWKFIYSRKFKFFNIVNSWNFCFFWGKPETAERNAEVLVTRPFSLSGGGRYFTVDLWYRIRNRESLRVFSSFFYKTNLCVSRFPLIQWWYSVFCFWQLPN